MATKTKVNTTFLKTLKKGATVILCAFTGMKLGVKEVIAVDKTTITIETANGGAVFDRKTGKQIDPEPKTERFANYLTEDDGSFVPPTRKPKAKKSESKAEEEDEDVEDDEEEEEEKKPAPKKKATKKAAKPAAKKSSKKKPEPEEEEEEWEEDDDEDDDEFEEID